MSGQNIISVMTADDHPLMMAGIAGEVNAQSDMRVVAGAADGEQALALFRIDRPDVTLMDLRMPKMKGIEAIIAIRQEAPRARVVVPTTAAGDVQMVRAFKAGAVGYLFKDLLRTEQHRSSCTPAVESSISGDVNGWSGETIFKLDNGQIWQQAEYDYTYFYEYHPDVTIYETSAGCRMKVEDEDETLLVKRIK